jgi:hypothetical protein
MGAWVAQVNMHSLHPNCAGNLWPKLPKLLSKLRETRITQEMVARDRANIARYMERVRKYRATKYLTDPARKRILPEHGQTRPVSGG